ncbi:MAG: hypothetical protein WBP10_10885 [Thermoanaerobaculia bacterium]
MTLTWIGVALLASHTAAAQEGGLKQILELHVARYPAMQPEDLYKLLHQAVMGSEHAISSREAARQWLIREIETLQRYAPDSLDAALIEPISPDGRLVRVNLRPYLRMAGDPEPLLEAFWLTAERFAGDSRTLDLYCKQAVNLAREGTLPFSPAVLETRFAELKQQGYPAVHHSKQYTAEYQPAYRVVLRELLPRV